MEHFIHNLNTSLENHSQIYTYNAPLRGIKYILQCSSKNGNAVNSWEVILRQAKWKLPIPSYPQYAVELKG